MDKIDVDGVPFSVLMDRAVKLKSMQMSEGRKKWDAFPSFYQHSIFPNDEVDAARNLSDFNERLAVASQIKDEGNAAYQEGRLSDALLHYEKALSVFRYLENTNPEWKNEGIKDSFVKEISYKCHDEIETKELDTFLRNCYNNIALVTYKMKDYKLSKKACDYAIALSVDNKSDIHCRNAQSKSYFLRAQSRLAPLSSGATDEQAAVFDLNRAVLLNPKNSAARKLLRATMTRAKSQASKCKQCFSGLFDRGEVYKEEEVLSQQTVLKDQKTAHDRDVILGRQLMQHYEEQGMEAEKENLQKSLDAEIQRRNKAVDFRNPTDEMIKDAASMGVDLWDPQTVELLMNMQQNNVKLSDEPTEDEVSREKVSAEKRRERANYIRIIGYVLSLVLWALLVRKMGLNMFTTERIK